MTAAQLPVIREAAPAKVNLCLHVTGQRPDGYHLLESLVVFADIADVVEARPANALSLSVVGPMAEGVPTDDSNLMLKAARLMAGRRGAALQLEKSLPHPAGIGGGSADAAATLRALSALWEVPVPAPHDLLPLGADVPVCLEPRPQFMSGIGEILTPVESLPPMGIVLVNPRVPTPTGAIFGALDRKDNPPLTPLPKDPTFAHLMDWLKTQRNDLQPPACQLVPEIDAVLDALAADAPFAQMSGSGATCFALYPSEQAARQAATRLARPGWWVRGAAVL